MASEQFILELHKKLHPDSDVNDIIGLTEAELFEIDSIINDKHTVILSSNWIPDKVTTDLKTLRNVLTTASLGCLKHLAALEAQTVGSLGDGHGRIDPVEVEKWEGGVAYYQNQLDAIKLIENGLLEPLRAATNREGFYMQGVPL